MAEIIATTESREQAQHLLNAGVDWLYAGEDEFGLRLPHSFGRDELPALVQLAHQAGKKIMVAVNAIFHNDRIVKVADYLQFLTDLHVDMVSIGDPGAIHVLQTNRFPLPYLYDGADLVTSSRQINFWGRHGAVAAQVAPEVPYGELVPLMQHVDIPVSYLVYGASVIHQSGRPLVDNYFSFVKQHQERSDRQRGLFISAPHKPETHYSIYEDINGTHVFATNDVNLMPALTRVHDLGIQYWKLDGLFVPGQQFAQIAAAFVHARDALAAGTWTADLAADGQHVIADNTPANRATDTGFFDIDPNEVQ
ncbi:peptidase U32 family protein [Schleiferilactobacillus harbinensis]|uniref:peptidase U32 family protein n=1 Tax=Schleiferilactobacillus harbinensis TaxID=304207 RepID=UPI00345E6287